jgi:hypothetical protein
LQSNLPQGDIKLTTQCIVSDDSGLTAIAARATLVSDLRRNACDTGQARHTVLRTCLASVTQIIRQFALAADLAAVGPGLLDEFGLTRILKRTRT